MSSARFNVPRMFLGRTCSLCHWLVYCYCANSFSYGHTLINYSQDLVSTPNAVFSHLHGSESAERLWERSSPEVSLGDAQDVVYNVLVNMGDVEIPLIVDTGSSDLWVLSSACRICENLSNKAPNSLPPLYAAKSFEDSGLNVTLHYGDSQTGTHAIGPVGKDTVGIGQFSSGDQYFAAIHDTNTSILDTGSAGIFGLGFPTNSILWRLLYLSRLGTSTSMRSPHQKRSALELLGLSQAFPSFPTFGDYGIGVGSPDDVNSVNADVPVVDLLASFSVYGPFLSRIVSQRSQEYTVSPQFTLLLERATIMPSKALGKLTIGEFPAGFAYRDFTWMPVRLYEPGAQGGLVVRSPGGERQKEMYPVTWEIPLEAVWFDGQKLPMGEIAAELKIGVTALLDSGNSLIRGPHQSITTILQALSPDLLSSSSSSSQSVKYPCSASHNLTFQFGGKLFPVDPRDFGRPVPQNDGEWCVPNIVGTDAPRVGGYLFSWSLGVPFLKGVLSTFYYGNLTHPSQDLPRIGLLSIVPVDADEKLEDAVMEAEAAGTGLPALSLSARTVKPTTRIKLGSRSLDTSFLRGAKGLEVGRREIEAEDGFYSSGTSILGYVLMSSVGASTSSTSPSPFSTPLSSTSTSGLGLAAAGCNDGLTIISSADRLLGVQARKAFGLVLLFCGILFVMLVLVVSGVRSWVRWKVRLRCIVGLG